MIFDQGSANTNKDKGALPPHDGAFIFEADTQDFEEKVINASMERPVLVDFWAPWCGPCKQLMPTLEKVVREAKGEVFLAKVNLDNNQQLAQMMRVQSVPTVFVFYQGQPIDGFQGVLPESQIQQFINKAIQVARQAQPDAIDIPEALQAAASALAEGDAQTAHMLYAQVLQQDPNQAQAFAGMVRVFIAAEQTDQAQAMMSQAPESIKNTPAYAEAEAALELALNKPDGETTELEAKLAKNENDHLARLDLAQHLFAIGQREAAIDHMLILVEKDRTWNEEAGRTQLIKFFKAMGNSDPLTIASRRKLSSILFS